MNVYLVEGKVEYIDYTDCPACGQLIEREEEAYILVEIRCEDEKSAADDALSKFILEHEDADELSVQWKSRSPRVELVREISEAERMTELGAPKLF